MVITISATLSPEEVQIISSIKWYSPTIPVGPWEPEVENPQTREDFIRQVYEAMIKDDAKRVFSMDLQLKRQEEQRLEEQYIQERIDGAISSNIDNA